MEFSKSLLFTLKSWDLSWRSGQSAARLSSVSCAKSAHRSAVGLPGRRAQWNIKGETPVRFHSERHKDVWKSRGWGQPRDAAAKLTLTANTRELFLLPLTSLLIQLPADMTRKAQEGSPSSWAPTPKWETQMEFRGPWIYFIQPWLLLPFENWISR